MRSINPGMLKAYQVARKSNAIAFAGKVHRGASTVESDGRLHGIGVSLFVALVE